MLIQNHSVLNVFTGQFFNQKQVLLSWHNNSKSKASDNK